MQKSQRVGQKGQRKKYSKINQKNQIKHNKRDANFSSLTHLKAALVGRIGGWLVRWWDKVQVGEGVCGQISKNKNRSDFQFPICSLINSPV